MQRLCLGRRHGRAADDTSDPAKYKGGIVEAGEDTTQQHNTLPVHYHPANINNSNVCITRLAQ